VETQSRPTAQTIDVVITDGTSKWLVLVFQFL
jgi:hypothetical protein